MHTFILIAKNVALEFWFFFGVLVTGGALLTFLARWTNNACGQFIFPRVGFYLLGFIGIPIHEFSHAFFCRVFFHKIQKIKWFDPKGRGGSHGAVTHQFHTWNLYHRIGQFFIGLGPTILGPLILGALFYFLLPAGRSLFLTPIADISETIPVGIGFAKVVFNSANLTSPRFYIFLYLTICISSQIELSPDDIKQVATGVLPILLVLLVANTASWALWGFNGGWHQRALTMSTHFAALMTCLFTFATVLSVVTLIAVTSVFGLINVFSGHRGINPFLQKTGSAAED